MKTSMPVAWRPYFVYAQSVLAKKARLPEPDAGGGDDLAVSRIASAIGEPARTRMLYCLMDGHARTGTELAIVAEVSPSTASVHLNRLKEECLVKVFSQGKHRYYSLDGPHVAKALEGLSVLAGGARQRYVPNTPNRLRAARTCYDHMAGALAVSLHDRFLALGLLSGSDSDYRLTATGEKSFASLGIDAPAVRALRRRFAPPCLDWSERRPHLGGALGSALLTAFLKKQWVTQDLDSRALTLTPPGRRALLSRYDLSI